MDRVRRPNLAPEAARRSAEQLARSGGELRDARLGRQLTQVRAGERAGIGRGVVSRIELGHGGAVSMDAWQRLALVVGRPLVIGVQRDVEGETRDAGHLAIQELILAQGRRAGFNGRFELAMRPNEPWRSADVGLIHDPRRMLLVVECWNTIGDVGAAARSSSRKLAEARDLATARWGQSSSSVGLVWVIRASARNRAIVSRYPEIFTSRFPGSSRGWIATVESAAAPPSEPGLIWTNIAATRLFAWRRRSGYARER